MLSEKIKFAYSALISHAERGTLTLMECLDEDDKPVAVLCVITQDERIVPIARMLPEELNPFTMFKAPVDQYHGYNAMHGVDPIPDLTN